MAKKHSIDTIAEVLIDKLTDMERVASKIESASKTELKVDVSNLKELFSEHRKVISNQLENGPQHKFCSSRTVAAIQRK